MKTSKALKRAGIVLLLLTVFAFACKQPNDEPNNGPGNEDIKISSIALGADFELEIDGEYTIVPAIEPEDAANQSIIWVSDDPDVATVNEDGLVTAVSAGTATITAAAQDGSGISGSVTVEVKGIPPKPVTSITINTEDLSIQEGTYKYLTVTVLPEDAGNKNIIWSSDNPDVARVVLLSGGSATYLLRAFLVGTAIITATAVDGSGVSDSFTVTVIPKLAETLTINSANFTLPVGWNKTLTVTITPANANQGVNWASTNPNVATVNSNGVVTGIATGTAAITAAAVDGSGKFHSVTVTVTTSMTPQEIFSSLKGQSVTTNGWADRANSGTGLKYANPANLTLIDDASYPNPVNKRTAFTTAINSDSAKFIIVSGDIDLSDGKINDNDKSFFDQFNPTAPYARVNGDIRFNMGSNTTLIGINNARLMFGGINISSKTNVIIRNITFYDAHGSTANDTTKPGQSESKASIDALTVQGTSDGVWVDHCKFTDGACNDMIRNYNHDGAFDIPRGKNITVSWCEFTNHDKVMLVAGSDSEDNAIVDRRQITLHHNYFHHTTQRMPRTRGTQMHVYNNYYDNIGVSGNSGYALGPGVNAHFIVENNYFGTFFSSSTNVIEYYDSWENAKYPAIVWSAENNKAVPRSPRDNGNSKPWNPAYSYTLEPYAGLPTSVPAGAGPILVVFP